MNKIFSGINFTISYNTDLANASPQGVGNVEIESIAAFPALTVQSSTQSIETYSDEYTTKLLGEMAVDDYEIVVNYMPDSTTHKFLDSMAESRDEFQVILTYNEDDTSIQFAITNGMIVASAVNGDKDEVVSKSYRFATTDLVTRSASIDVLKPLYQGDYGVGSNGDTVPQYQTDAISGNAFIKVPAAQAGNPVGADMMGVGLVDGISTSAIAVTKTGALGLFVKNGSTAWTRIYTATQMDSRYVPLTRTINGKALSANITLSKSDVGLENVTNDAQLKIASNLGDLNNVATARTNLSVYSKDETDAAYVPLTRTVNGKALSGDITLSKSDVGLSNVTNDAQLKIASNLSDLANVTTARTNLGLGTAAVSNVGTSGAVVPLLSTANTWSGVQTFTGTISGSISGTASNVTGTVAIANGGTGATTAAAARSNLGLGTSSTVNVGTSGAVVPLLSTANTWSGVQTFSNTISGSISGTASNVTGVVSIANGGTGANTTGGARANLGAVNIAGDAMSGVLSVPTSSGLRTADFTNTDSSLSYATISGEAGYAMLWRKDNSGAANQFIGIAGKALIFRQATDSSGGWADRTVYHSGNLPSVAEQGGVPVTSLGNVNLNNINGFNAGNYVQSANVNASTANNYPVPQSGSLVVLQNAANNTASCTQLYYPYSAGDVWMRRLQFSSGTVSAWTTWTRIAWNDANTMRSEIGLGSGDSVSFNGLISSGNITCSSGVIYSRATSQTSNSHFWMHGHTGASRAVLYSNYSGITQLRVDNENTGASGYAFQFSTSGGFSCGSLTQTSDERSKSNLIKVENALDKVKQLNGYTFDVRVTESITTQSAGLIAQDIEKVLPIAVSNGGTGYDAEGNELQDQKSVNYSSLSAIYVEAIKELSIKLDEQQNQIDELTSLVQSLINK